ncbi:MAG: nucleotide exchange factor GrpE [Dongiaceae bacterium]
MSDNKSESNKPQNDVEGEHPNGNPLDDESGDSGMAGDSVAGAGTKAPEAAKPGDAAAARDDMTDDGAGAPVFEIDEEEPIDPLAVLREELTVLRGELEAARAEGAQYKDQLLRALAEGENQRRRAAREREDAVKFAGSVLAKDLLAVADNFDRALANIPEDALANDPALKALHEGIAATQRELAAAFERHRIRKIDPMGEKFDSHRHQAMFEIETADVPPGHVAQVLQPGYIMHDERLLRAAMVAVAKAPPPPKAANDPGAGNKGETSGGR